MKKLKLITLLYFSLFISACSTTYQPSGFTGGYEETQLDTNVFRVSFEGNGFTSSQKTTDFTLRRSAELTQESGYSYFVIINQNTDISNSTYTTPQYSTTTGNVDNSGYFSANTNTSGGQTYNISKPTTSNTIVCYKQKPAGILSYNAAFILRSMAAKYP
jgi:hypothetical protein